MLLFPKKKNKNYTLQHTFRGFLLKKTAKKGVFKIFLVFFEIFEIFLAPTDNLCESWLKRGETSLYLYVQNKLTQEVFKMKLFYSIALALVVSLFGLGCGSGVSQEDLDKVQSELEAQLAGKADAPTAAQIQAEESYELAAQYDVYVGQDLAAGNEGEPYVVVHLKPKAGVEAKELLLVASNNPNIVVDNRVAAPAAQDAQKWVNFTFDKGEALKQRICGVAVAEDGTVTAAEDQKVEVSHLLGLVQNKAYVAVVGADNALTEVEELGGTNKDPNVSELVKAEDGSVASVKVGDQVVTVSAEQQSQGDWKLGSYVQFVEDTKDEAAYCKELKDKVVAAEAAAEGAEGEGAAAPADEPGAAEDAAAPEGDAAAPTEGEGS